MKCINSIPRYIQRLPIEIDMTCFFKPNATKILESSLSTTIHNLCVTNIWSGDYDKDLLFCKEALKLGRKVSLSDLEIIYYAKCDLKIELQPSYRYWKEAIDCFCSFIVGTRNDYSSIDVASKFEERGNNGNKNEQLYYVRKLSIGWILNSKKRK